MRFSLRLRSWFVILGVSVATGLGCTGLQEPSADSSPILPNSALTPGAVLSVTCAQICQVGYSESVRDVPLDLKRQVYAEYGITDHAPGEYEVDHLISLELGGSNSIKNLWPESYDTQPWNAHVKDQLENLMHALVCSHRLPLTTAQQAIAQDWISAYKDYFNTDSPLSDDDAEAYCDRIWDPLPAERRVRSTSTAYVPRSAPVSAGGEVWVNTRSGKFFLPGSQYFGRTREGEYMSESSALEAGYVAAKARW